MRDFDEDMLDEWADDERDLARDDAEEWERDALCEDNEGDEDVGPDEDWMGDDNG
jgi:hypothetical protein